MPLGQSFVDRRHDLLVAQYLISVLHPRFVQILDFLGSPSPKLRCVRRVSITLLPRASRWGVLRTQQRVVELADVLERFLELVVITLRRSLKDRWFG
jgi:hypothetical protein